LISEMLDTKLGLITELPISNFNSSLRYWISDIFRHFVFIACSWLIEMPSTLKALAYFYI
jgi:hypothetical protein